MPALETCLPIPRMKCLTLLASTGAAEGWNNPAQSSRFRAIPLIGPDALAKLPMFSQLFAQLHIDLPFREQTSSSLLVDPYTTTFNAFYVPRALDSPYVPDQTEFVVPFGVQSVVGYGGLLPTGEMFAVILFTNVPVSRDTADLFKTFALSIRPDARAVRPCTIDRAGATTDPATRPDRA